MKARDAGALASLERDHRLLWGLTEALRVYVSAMERGRPLRRGDLRALASGLRVIGDYRHFEKEDEVLVPAVVRHGFAYNLDIFEEARHEHDALRYLIEVLSQSAQREPSWRVDERLRISCVARQLIERQRRLSARQERRLFPEIVARLSPEALGQLTERLEQFDASRAAREATLDAAGLSRSIVAHYADTLPSSRELTG